MTGEEIPRAIRYPEPGEPYIPSVHRLPPLEPAAAAQEQFAAEELLAAEVAAALVVIREEMRSGTANPYAENHVTLAAATGRLAEDGDRSESYRPVVVISGPQIAKRNVLSPVVDPMGQEEAVEIAREAIKLADQSIFGGSHDRMRYANT